LRPRQPWWNKGLWARLQPWHWWWRQELLLLLLLLLLLRRGIDLWRWPQGLTQDLAALHKSHGTHVEVYAMWHEFYISVSQSLRELPTETSLGSQPAQAIDY
jgi:hypothetical protein